MVPGTTCFGTRYLSAISMKIDDIAYFYAIFYTVPDTVAGTVPGTLPGTDLFINVYFREARMYNIQIVLALIKDTGVMICLRKKNLIRQEP